MSIFTALVSLPNNIKTSIKFEAYDYRSACSMIEHLYGKESSYNVNEYHTFSTERSSVAPSSYSSSSSSSSSVASSSSSPNSTSSKASRMPNDGEMSGLSLFLIVIFSLILMIFGAIIDPTIPSLSWAPLGLILGWVIGASLPIIIIMWPVIIGLIVIGLVIAIGYYAWLHLAGVIGTIVVSTILIAMALDFYNDWIKNKRKDDHNEQLRS